MRNGILNSRADGTGTRNLRINGQFIFWEFWMAAQEWDATQNVGCRLNRKLTYEAVHLDKSSKMRNSFAIAALDVNMLDLMKVEIYILLNNTT